MNFSGVIKAHQIESSFAHALGNLQFLPELIRNKVNNSIEKVLIKALEDAHSEIEKISKDIDKISIAEAEEIYKIIIPYYNKLAQEVYKNPVPNNTEVGRKFNAYFDQLTKLIDKIERISDEDMFNYCMLND